MEFWALYIVSLPVIGLLSGFIGGLFGVGGGIVRIPLFLYLFPVFGVHADVLMHVASGTSLALAIPSSIMATHEQYKTGNLDINFLKSWIPALVLGVIIGIFLMRFVSSRFLEQVFAFVILIVSLHMFFTSSDFKITGKFPGIFIKSISAFFIGILSKLTGLTGGSYSTPVLTAYGYPIHRSIAVAASGAFFVSIFGTAGSIINGFGIEGRSRLSLGYIDLTAVLIMIIPIILTAPKGVNYANKLSQDKLRWVFAIFLFIVALDMIRNLYII